MGEPVVGFKSAWQYSLKKALEDMLQDPSIAKDISKDHIQKTPQRAVAAITEMFSGCLVNPSDFLEGKFINSSNYSQMVHIKKIKFYSECVHHLLPFFGTAHFAYIPCKYIVGLSKIPRLIDAFSRRPQVQEKLTDEIVDTFDSHLTPVGCGLVMRGYHFCMICRGVREPEAYTQTTSLRGSFLEGAKQEFLTAAQDTQNFWG